MPTYEYECEKCKEHFDLFQKMTDEPLKKCPKCKGKVNRLIGSGGGIIFRGSGFYANDYKKRERVNEERKSCPAAGSDSCVDCPKNKD